jgi:hypothetical protein
MKANPILSKNTLCSHLVEIGNLENLRSFRILKTQALLKNCCKNLRICSSSVVIL